MVLGFKPEVFVMVLSGQGFKSPPWGGDHLCHLGRQRSPLLQEVPKSDRHTISYLKPPKTYGKTKVFIIFIPPYPGF